MRLIRTSEMPPNEVRALLSSSPLTDNQEVEEIVRGIIKEVRLQGEEAVLEYTRRFDCPGLETLKVSSQEIEVACGTTSEELLSALRAAHHNIEAFHRKQIRPSWFETDADGVVLGQVIRPIDTVGFYAPGGRAPYPSTVLMVATPAKVAGVRRVILCTPPGKDGSIHPGILAAASVAGVDEIYKIGGAQAIAAMAFGTKTVPRVDKVVGPGSPYVVTAKRLLFGYVGIEMLPGPSEIMIVADDSARPRYVAADLVSQAEHGEDSPVILATPSEALAQEVLKEIETLSEELSRKETIAKCLLNFGLIFITKNIREACELVNIAAPEHVELAVSDPLGSLSQIRNAGAIMLGHYSPVPLGDYFAGPSHTLPTGGTARFSSPLHVDDFFKKSSIVSYTRDRLLSDAAPIITLAEAEGFDAHALTVRVRQDE